MKTILAQPGQSLLELDVPKLRQQVLQHKVLLLRGYPALDSQDFVAYAQGWGEILRWNFGEILNVQVDPQAKNYLFTCGSVPHHWDGAFTQQVPFLQLFQCLASPGPGSGGETVFCDSGRLWREASAEQQRRWASIQINYHTEKLAHYGGSLRAPLVAQHPLTGETTLRFAEPPDQHTAPLNPLELEVEGADLEELLAELRPLLYSPDYCYEHAWQSGDFLVADNHALLHARRPFAQAASRHLQRIHIL